MLATVVALAAALLLSGGCAAQPQGGATDRLRVVAAFYPLQFVAELVGGEHVEVTGLTPPGVDAHDLELTPSQVARIAEADLVLHLAGFQPAVDDAVATHAGAALDVAEVVPPAGDDGHDDGHGHDDDGHDDGHDDDGHGHGAGDPHVWLDPQRMAAITAEVAARLAALDPARAGQFTANAARLGQDLATLDADLVEGLADCQRREIVVGHAAFSYLADRYDLTQIAVSGLSPEDEPTPGQLAEVVALAREHGATTIYFETLAGPRVAQVIADQVGARTAVLDPIEGLPAGGSGDYFTIMRANLESLRSGLDCR
jgi:zinc transport system substrate-binding protein